MMLIFPLSVIIYFIDFVINSTKVFVDKNSYNVKTKQDSSLFYTNLIKEENKCLTQNEIIHKLYMVIEKITEDDIKGVKDLLLESSCDDKILCNEIYDLLKRIIFLTFFSESNDSILIQDEKIEYIKEKDLDESHKHYFKKMFREPIEHARGSPYVYNLAHELCEDDEKCEKNNFDNLFYDFFDELCHFLEKNPNSDCVNKIKLDLLKRMSKYKKNSKFLNILKTNIVDCLQKCKKKYIDDVNSLSLDDTHNGSSFRNFSTESRSLYYISAGELSKLVSSYCDKISNIIIKNLLVTDKQYSEIFMECCWKLKSKDYVKHDVSDEIKDLSEKLYIYSSLTFFMTSLIKNSNFDNLKFHIISVFKNSKEEKKENSYQYADKDEKTPEENIQDEFSKKNFYITSIKHILFSAVVSIVTEFQNEDRNDLEKFFKTSLYPKNFNFKKKMESFENFQKQNYILNPKSINLFFVYDITIKQNSFLSPVKSLIEVKSYMDVLKDMIKQKISDVKVKTEENYNLIEKGNLYDGRTINSLFLSISIITLLNKNNLVIENLIEVPIITKQKYKTDKIKNKKKEEVKNRNFDLQKNEKNEQSDNEKYFIAENIFLELKSILEIVYNYNKNEKEAIFNDFNNRFFKFEKTSGSQYKTSKNKFFIKKIFDNILIQSMGGVTPFNYSMDNEIIQEPQPSIRRKA